MSEGTVRFDTRGIVVLHGLRQRLSEHQTTLVLVIPQDGRIRRAIELVRLADFMPIKGGLEEALHAVG